MRLDNAVAGVKAVLAESDRLEGVKIIDAFPNKAKQTRLDGTVVAIGLYQLDLEGNQLDSNERAGTLSIFADIYVPTKTKGEYACRVLCDICDALDTFNIIAISAQKPEYHNDIQALLLKTVITFNDEICFGGGENE